MYGRERQLRNLEIGKASSDRLNITHLIPPQPSNLQLLHQKYTCIWLLARLPSNISSLLHAEELLSTLTAPRYVIPPLFAPQPPFSLSVTPLDFGPVSVASLLFRR